MVSTIDPLPRVPPARRWGAWRAVIGGSLLSLPLAWLLARLAFLPYMIGLFFYALAGLLIGAVVFRLARDLRPLPRPWTRLASLVLVAVCWGTSFVFEVRQFPEALASEVLERLRELPEERTREECREQLRAEAFGRLREAAWPGGMLGYARWMLGSSRLEVQVLDSVRVAYTAPQYRWWWGVRVLLSILLLSYGVHSQVATLGPKRPILESPEAPGEPASAVPASGAALQAKETSAA